MGANATNGPDELGSEKIAREPLRRRVSEVLVDWVVSGRLKPASRFNESRLAERLGVSRTPLREALIELERDGLVEFRQGKGFYVRPLNPKRAQDLFELIGILEKQAMLLCPRWGEEERGELRAINERRFAEGAPRRQVDLDVQWHETLLADCPNRELKAVLQQVRRRLYRYEYAFMRNESQLQTAIEQHEEILAALSEEDPERAADLLQDHWMTGFSGATEVLGTAEKD